MYPEYLFSIRNKLRKRSVLSRYKTADARTGDARLLIFSAGRQLTAAATPLAAGYNSAVTLC